MRVLLDECCHRRIVRTLPGHQVTTVQEAGWSGLKNGALLKLIGGQFDVFVTQDQHIPHQNVFAGRSFGVVVLIARQGR